MWLQILQEIEHDPRDRCIILDTRHGVFKIDRHGQMWDGRDCLAFRSELMLPQNFYVYDARPGATPMDGIFAKILIAASPNKQHYSQLQKEPTFARLFMPTWDLDELQLCREHCYSGISAVSVAHMYSMVGGVPRAVFSQDQQEQDRALAELRKAVDGMSFRRCVLCALRSLENSSS